MYKFIEEFLFFFKSTNQIGGAMAIHLRAKSWSEGGCVKELFLLQILTHISRQSNPTIQDLTQPLKI